MSRVFFSILTILLILGSGDCQICEDVAPFGNFFIQQGSSFCVNCPRNGSSIQWTINNIPLASFSPPLNFTVFDNSSLLMRSSQEGSYRCVNSTVDIHRFTVVLAVDAPPFITDPTVYNETDNVRLICRSNATPSPITSWQRNGVTVGSFALLEVDSIQRSGAGTYTCCAVREVAGESVTTCRDFTITVQYQPTILSSPPSDILGKMNMDYAIQCTFEGVPSPIVVWLLNGLMLANGSSDITIATDNTSSTLTITALMANKTGNYTCMAINLLGSITASTLLHIAVPATVSNFTAIGADDNCIARGQDSNMTCTYGGVPQPSILWYKGANDNRVNIIASDAGYVVITTPTESILTIRNVVSVDAGIYGCEASNTVNGSVLVDYAEINVTVCTIVDGSAVRSGDLTARIIIFLSILAIVMHN